MAVRVSSMRRSYSLKMKENKDVKQAYLDISQHDLNHTVLAFDGQDVILGDNVLPQFCESYKVFKYSKSLIVTDKGLIDSGALNFLFSSLDEHGIKYVVNHDSTPNPTTHDTLAIANAYLSNDCDSVIGVGGGGPVDSTKAAMAVVAMKKTNPSFDIEKSGVQFVATELPNYISTGFPEGFQNNVPHISAIPTTAGTGSEGGKSAVITKPDGSKLVFGHPIFLPKLVALVPQLTYTLPKSLTAATGIDAMFHLMEAYFVPYQVGVEEGMSDTEIKLCEEYALQGIQIILECLENAYKQPENVKARLSMLLASLYGAKAFRKGALGGVHACAHAVGAHYHQHHGTCIARMSVPVLKNNEESGVVPEKFELVRDIFAQKKIEGKTLSECVQNYLNLYDLPVGLEGLDKSDDVIEKLAVLASKDGCQTNPVPLDLGDYQRIFRSLK